MRKGKNIFLIGIGVFIFLIFAALIVISLKPKPAGLLIETNPQSRVFISGREVGKTPYDASLLAKEIEVRLIPVDAGLVEFNGKIKLTPGIKTIIRRQFGTSETETEGEIVSFEKSGGEETSIAIISVPDSAQVVIDGQTKGFTPLKIVRLIEGEHLLEVKQEGYREKSLSVKTVKGYRLTADVKLATSPKVEIKALVEDAKYVEILKTPTGYLRVREAPLTASQEIAQVSPGEKYKLLKTDDRNGWFEIELEDAKTGWISPDYATIFATPRY